jgi:hypothetical protein
VSDFVTHVVPPSLGVATYLGHACAKPGRQVPLGSLGCHAHETGHDVGTLSLHCCECVCQVVALGGPCCPVGRRFGDRVASDASMVSPRQHRVCIAAAAVARREGRTKFEQFTFRSERPTTASSSPPLAPSPSGGLHIYMIHVSTEAGGWGESP